MSASRKPQFSSSFLESYMYELMSMTDEEILEGKDVDEITQRAANLVAAANRDVGRKRLAVAKARLKKRDETLASSFSASLDEMKAYIREVAAINDGRFTLAARQLSEMSEADTRRLYTQIKQLEDGQGEGN
ncbi:hypothetical protein [Pandoraea apista]|uniref:hypothetical protein n=1 Tax=Pandoraea apista TaxID=93218 RepID=UPI00058AA0A7|nr:hypothetical protein [Pandoraea apista]AJE99145.1 hypothetical protein SG18_14865 [Pandoraea apista]AKH73245.1 hypothetical protein XM39_15060 [Pandoraea apista]AKI61641.1 hypothetical protein AA956_07400 [Pandoraea apista]